MGVQDLFTTLSMDRKTRLHWASQVKSVRQLRGLKQSDLAEIAGVSRGTVGNIENGAMAPHVKSLWSVMQALDLDPDPAHEWPSYVEEYIRMLAPLIMRLEEKSRGEVMGEVIMLLGRATKDDQA